MSIAYDFDLRYEQKDLARFYEDGWRGCPAGLFLNKHDDVYYYAKPFIYSFLSSPFTRLIGTKGPILWNCICLFLMILLIFRWARKRQSFIVSAALSVAFLFFSTAWIWVRVIHPDLSIALLLMCAIHFLLEYFEKEGARTVHLILSGVFFGLAVFEKPPLVIIFIPFFIYLLFKKKTGHAFLLLIILLAALSIPTSIVYRQINALTSYHGYRFYFLVPPFVENSSTVPNIEGSREMFSFRYLTANVASGFGNLPCNLFYYLLGAQTGVLAYFPMTGVVIISRLNGRRRIKPFSVLFIGILSYILFYLILFSNNYYGGSGTFGNRYFLQMYPALLLGLGPINFKKAVRSSAVYAVIVCSFLIYTYIFFTPFANVREHTKWLNSSRMTQVLPVEKTLLPVLWIPEIELEKNDGVILYNSGEYADYDGEGFWIKGGEKNRLYLVSDEILNHKYLRVSLHSGLYGIHGKAIDNEVVIRQQKRTRIGIVANSQTKISILLKNYTRVFWEGEKKYIYRITISCKDGFYLDRPGVGSLFVGVYVSNIEIP
jgi:hypothetical protein